MTAKVITCAPGDELRALAITMTDKRFRHMPVIVDGKAGGHRVHRRRGQAPGRRTADRARPADRVHLLVRLTPDAPDSRSSAGHRREPRRRTASAASGSRQDVACGKLGAVPEVSIDRASRPALPAAGGPVRAFIETGALQPGQRIENEEQLAARLELSRPTVARAMNRWSGAGCWSAAGASVPRSARPSVHQRTALTSLFEDLDRNRRQPGTRVLQLSAGVAQRRGGRRCSGCRPTANCCTCAGCGSPRTPPSPSWRTGCPPGSPT